MTDTTQSDSQRFSELVRAAWVERKPRSAKQARDQSLAIWKARGWDDLPPTRAAAAAYAVYREMRK
jgi:hypothetical protein